MASLRKKQECSLRFPDEIEFVPGTCATAQPRTRLRQDEGRGLAMVLAPDDTVVLSTTPYPNLATPPTQLKLLAGQPHLVLGDRCELIPAPDFAVGSTFTVLRLLSPQLDIRASRLVGYWQGRGFPTVQVQEVLRIAPSRVMGQIAPEWAGKVIQTSHGELTLQEGMWALRNPDDPELWWMQSNTSFRQLYGSLMLEGGKVQPLRALSH